MNSPEVMVVDFGVGNLFSIEKAISHVGGKPEITDDPEKIASAERLVLPGVGAFGSGMHKLEKRGLETAIKAFVQTGRPLLGICLGMQLLLTESCEFGRHRGLGLIDGEVIRLKSPMSDGPHFKIPQIGWAEIEFPVTNESPTRTTWNHTILEEIAPGSFFYFVHSYFCAPADEHCVLAESFYGHNRFCSVINKDNIWGCQFHPEKSDHTGLQIYRNFLNL
jgi:glutamine amidotransferase